MSFDQDSSLHGQDGPNVNHPHHYGGAENPYEAIKVIESWELGFCLGNTVKYIARHAHKGSPLEDLKKARWYLQREIERLEGNGGRIQLKGGVRFESGGSAAGCRVVETAAAGCRVVETTHTVWQGPYFGREVENKVTEKMGKIVVDDNENIVVEWGKDNQGTFARKVFEEGLKEGWLKFSGEENGS